MVLTITGNEEEVLRRSPVHIKGEMIDAAGKIDEYHRAWRASTSLQLHSRVGSSNHRLCFGDSKTSTILTSLFWDLNQRAKGDTIGGVATRR